MWVRGLKHTSTYQTLAEYQVAPYVGAWIETLATTQIYTHVSSRTLCGCVD